jgi:dTDP-4-amino-4,6-dideoxygalactose transaminase
LHPERHERHQARAMKQEPIYVTKAFLPPEEEYLGLVRRVLASGVLTNNGPLHRELEGTLKQHLEQEHLVLLSNGTIAIQLALRALGVKGKVITTPFSYVATVSALLWEGLEPVFADVLPGTLCIDPAKIEALIDGSTTAILATHVYGLPCDVEAIEDIARRHGLKVIYDGAHAFDTRYHGRQLVGHGDACTLSFHATKLFHTVEGGATVVHDAHIEHEMGLLRSFGHVGDEHFSLGVNGKMSEVHAAMGLAVLPHVRALIAARKHITDRYDERLHGKVRRPVIPPGTEHNHAYHPVFFRDRSTRERVMAELGKGDVHARRYFFPSLNTLPYVKAPAMPVSEHAADTVLCLPLYPGLTDAQVDRISDLVIAAL